MARDAVMKERRGMNFEFGADICRKIAKWAARESSYENKETIDSLEVNCSVVSGVKIYAEEPVVNFVEDAISMMDEKYPWLGGLFSRYSIQIVQSSVNPRANCDPQTILIRKSADADDEFDYLIWRLIGKIVATRLASQNIYRTPLNRKRIDLLVSKIYTKACFLLNDLKPPLHNQSEHHETKFAGVGL